MSTNATTEMPLYSNGRGIFLLAFGPVVVLICLVFVGIDYMCMASWCESVSCCRLIGFRINRRRQIRTTGSTIASIPLMPERRVSQEITEEIDGFSVNEPWSPMQETPINFTNGRPSTFLTPKLPRVPYDLPPSYEEALALIVRPSTPAPQLTADETFSLSDQTQITPMDFTENLENNFEADNQPDTRETALPYDDPPDECIGQFKVSGSLVIWPHPYFPSPRRLLFLTNDSVINSSIDGLETPGQSLV